MIDQAFTPWLIEVNTNPCLETNADLLNRIIPAMLENAFKLAVDPLFPEPPSTPKSLPTHLSSIGTNKFELIFHSEHHKSTS